jgi:Na+-translocating ferredoxin:NAD+ oxidoreductase RnfA subunit
MNLVAPLLVAAVFATLVLALCAPVIAADSPLRPPASRLALLAVAAALVGSLLSTLAGAGLAPWIVNARVAFALQVAIVVVVAGGLGWLVSRRRPAAAGPPAGVLIAAIGGACVGVVAAAMRSPLDSAVAAATSAAVLVAAAALAPAVRERLDAGDAPGRLRGRPLAVLSAAIAALAVAAALHALRP